jgi:cytochrome b561
MNNPVRFSAPSRFLHWLMAVRVLAMLFIGLHMVVSVEEYHALVSLHKPLGIALLLLAIIRLVNRKINPPPALPASMPRWQRFAAHASHYVLYLLLLAMPLIGWAMLSAQDYPVTLWSGIVLPPITVPNPMLYAQLRALHTALAAVLGLTILVHIGAALLHALIFRDGVFSSMAPWTSRKR